MTVYMLSVNFLLAYTCYKDSLLVYGGLAVNVFGMGHIGHMICMIHMQPQGDQTMEHKCLGGWLVHLGEC